MRQEGYGAGYIYDHSTEEGFSGQNYFPDGLERQAFYRPEGRGYEAEIKTRLEAWAQVRRKAARAQRPGDG
jgi:putative ATPase